MAWPSRSTLSRRTCTRPATGAFQIAVRTARPRHGSRCSPRSPMPCGPAAFMDAMREGLLAAGVRAERIHTEAFGAATTAGTPARTPHPPPGEPEDGPAVVFARSGLTVRWSAAQGTLLELAEACDVPADWSCRTGVCHRCESGLVDGAVSYEPEPLDAPAPGCALLCCALPAGDVTLDL